MAKPISHFYQNNYVRDLDFKKHYIEEVSFGLARMRGISIEEATNAIINHQKNDTSIINPKVKYIGKNEYGDRIRCSTTMNDYINYADKNNKILTATMVVIDNHKEHLGIIPSCIGGMQEQRRIAKKQMYEYRDKGDYNRYIIKKNEQNNLKRTVNALSGATMSRYNINYIASGHPILTSTCRVIISCANSSNEKFLAGNRPYYTADHVIEDICHICCKSDQSLVQAAIDKYNLHIPTVDELMEMIKSSTVYYWDSDIYMSKIYKLIAGLTPVERVMVMYNGDFYHLTKYNPTLVRSLFDEVINLDHDHIYSESNTDLGKDSAILLFAKSTMIDDLKNIDFGTIKTEHPEIYQRLCNTYNAIDNIINDNIILINAFWVTRILPRDVGHFPQSYRKVGLLSDTDSTVFTTQYYLKWYLGEDYVYDDKAWTIASLMTYLVSSIIQHYLAQVSTNIGADEEHRYVLSMKSEYLFGMLGLTGRGKHYYTWALLQEGRTLGKDDQWDIKGSALIASKVSPKVTKRANDMLHHVLTQKLSNKPVYVSEVIKDVTSLEQEIEESILSGSIEYLRNVNIKRNEDYKTSDSAQYFNYEFWQYVYSETYGSIDHLPYDGVRLTLTLTTRARLNTWIDTIDDTVIKHRIKEIMAKKRKDKLPSIVLPLNIVSSIGIPKEFHPVINTNLMIVNLINNYYLLLESFGLYITRNNNGKKIITTRDRIAKDVSEFNTNDNSLVYQLDE